jgi:hypothetical protein
MACLEAAPSVHACSVPWAVTAGLTTSIGTASFPSIWRGPEHRSRASWSQAPHHGKSACSPLAGRGSSRSRLPPIHVGHSTRIRLEASPCGVALRSIHTLNSSSTLRVGEKGLFSPGNRCPWGQISHTSKPLRTSTHCPGLGSPGELYRAHPKRSLPSRSPRDTRIAPAPGERPLATCLLICQQMDH